MYKLVKFKRVGLKGTFRFDRTWFLKINAFSASRSLSSAKIFHDDILVAILEKNKIPLRFKDIAINKSFIFNQKKYFKIDEKTCYMYGGIARQVFDPNTIVELVEK